MCMCVMCHLVVMFELCMCMCMLALCLCLSGVSTLFFSSMHHMLLHLGLLVLAHTRARVCGVSRVTVTCHS